MKTKNSSNKMLPLPFRCSVWLFLRSGHFVVSPGLRDLLNTNKYEVIEVQDFTSNAEKRQLNILQVVHASLG